MGFLSKTCNALSAGYRAGATAALTGDFGGVKRELKAFAADNRGNAAVTGMVMTLIMVGVFAGVGIIILAKFKNQTSDSTAQSAISDSITALKDISTWLGLLVVVVMGGIAVSYLLVYLGGQSGGDRTR